MKSNWKFAAMRLIYVNCANTHNSFWSQWVWSTSVPGGDNLDLCYNCMENFPYFDLCHQQPGYTFCKGIFLFSKIPMITYIAPPMGRLLCNRREHRSLGQEAHNLEMCGSLLILTAQSLQKTSRQGGPKMKLTKLQPLLVLYSLDSKGRREWHWRGRKSIVR